MARKTIAVVVSISCNSSYGHLLRGMRSDKCWSDAGDW